MFSRREFILTCISAIPGSRQDKRTLKQVVFPYHYYTLDSLLHRVDSVRSYLLEDTKWQQADLEIALVFHLAWPDVTVRTAAENYAKSTVWDLFPDPGHINFNRVHPVLAVCKEFDARVQKLKPSLKYHRVHIRIRG